MTSSNKRRGDAAHGQAGKLNLCFEILRSALKTIPLVFELDTIGCVLLQLAQLLLRALGSPSSGSAEPPESSSKEDSADVNESRSPSGTDTAFGPALAKDGATSSPNLDLRTDAKKKV